MIALRLADLLGASDAEHEATLGITSRAAATLFATQHGLVGAYAPH